jgi:tripartite-type tricarboxylate transporter receptor subunit TctC
MPTTKSKLWKSIGILFAIFLTLTASATAAMAADYPSKPIRLVIPFAPGGSNDIVGRLISVKLSERLATPVIVDNRGGAGGVIGSEVVMREQPDGYTLLMVSSAFTFSPALYNLRFDPVKSFSPISKLASGANVLTVHPSVPVNSVKELIALAKQKLGQLLCPAAGIGSFQHMGSELFKMMAGIDYTIVQFKGGGLAMTDQLGGHSHFSLSSLVTAMPHIQAGKFRVLGTGGQKRSALLPDVPTISESGVPGYEATQWWGISAPAGTPAPIVDRLNKEFRTIMASAEVKNIFMKEGADVDYRGPAELNSFIEREIIKWKRVVSEANIKVQ